MSFAIIERLRHKAVWGSRRLVLPILSILLVVLGMATTVGAAPKHRQHLQNAAKARPGVPSARVKAYKLDAELTDRAKSGNNTRTTRVIVSLQPGASVPAEFKRYMNVANGRLDIINGQVLDLPNHILRQLAAHPSVFNVHYDREIGAHNYRTSVTVGARAVHSYLGYTGAGVGVAVIDSGMSVWHDDLTNHTATLFPYGNQRVRKFVDFVNQRTTPYDDNGHGTHVSGIVAGNGYDSYGEKTGIAPDANIISLKVLDAQGKGTISNIIAALNWVAVNHVTYNIKVVNMSVGAGIYESYWTDPLTLATKAVTDKGITVVTAAGNMGKNAAGQLQKGGITAPGNAPWVLTVGATSTNGTLTRYDDQMASFSSSGPTARDFEAKPDLVAPGTGTISLAVPGSTFYTTKVAALLSGRLGLGSKPYLSLSGTSMAAPVVSGTVALMLQANPTLTPNLIKAILQYTSQKYPGYSSLRQGAGFLNALGAVRLAKYYATAQTGDKMPIQSVWSKQIIWGNHRLTHGTIKPTANAWANATVWGTAKTLVTTGENIVWGTMCGDCENIVWGTFDAENIVWGTNDDENIVWGTAGTIDNIVWGTLATDENIVWGTDCGGADCENIVWGTADLDNIVWGTAQDNENIVWGTSGDENIVWGTSSGEDVTWGSSGDDADAVVYPEFETEPLPSLELEFGDIVVPVVEPVAVPGLPGGGI